MKVNRIENAETGAYIEYAEDKVPVFPIEWVTIENGKLVYCRVAQSELPDLVREFLGNLNSTGA